ncbi:S-methyl-5-thioribose-1-phosphate isomerase [Aminobacterium sp. UBA5277]|uniref:S-methyl-5-thioribose-1-phosphate isomerase n=1 Tax=Aminobacterium sp. UBA5277 TaxID=1946029 RepID=UPI00257D48B7|nr:S-methyl-5-thioribose-1-phosphate isomerase [Aminobacterium sp. UBA5277]
MALPSPVSWDAEKNRLKILDQRQLPWKVSFLFCSSYLDVAEAIETLAVRGAPAIGVTAAYGVALSALHGEKKSVDLALKRLASTRPTAINLFGALHRMKKRAATLGSKVLFTGLLEEAHKILEEDLKANRQMGELGKTLFPQKSIVLTHCNAGALATAGYGTALGVLRAAREHGKEIKVFVDETRPVFQGARLTAWELLQDGFDVTVICDNMAGGLMQKNAITSVIVGADRIAANGDTANKIGTYSLAILAHYHQIPFYVAAPTTTIDYSAKAGSHICIEERDGTEVRTSLGSPLIPDSFPVWNPAFDITPSQLICAIITEKGVVFPPFIENLAKL